MRSWKKQQQKLNEICKPEEDKLEAASGGGPLSPGPHPRPPIKTKRQFRL